MPAAGNMHRGRRLGHPSFAPRSWATVLTVSTAADWAVTKCSTIAAVAAAGERAMAKRTCTSRVLTEARRTWGERESRRRASDHERS